MWSKSVIAIIGGCLVSISVMLNLNYLLPVMVDTRLFIGLLISFPLWVTTMIFCYGSKNSITALKRCSLVLIMSMSINAFFVVGS